MSSVPRAVVRHTKLGRKSVAARVAAVDAYGTQSEWSPPILVTAR